ncbi:hypothetical protein SPRG_12864 [Saprolegnia parasitica CBS 223.65]|uniref:ZZ-type domain-containing protein n=1 Tax=Saprolegnia parasitica (strain CBS 223.65) TaxID=695850 RepID=A0A067BXQ7_SAPPC|nr:hypothetical protein SPRG_12864 [Saprolegnia parasitica CBS 223.65]KDO21625.1 hypothetical protein SPRG_12864 [Saprolegnia parasitica CBS 223.65]|eukprot:XP_012207639.1 hypothetical protein SPRG_12864 [Saprolegnia parasitica CBS 223.65]
MSIPTSKIMVTVGNESPHDVPLTKISLQEYLSNIHKYTELERSMYAPAHDHQALVSTQACFLPIEEATGKAEFHVGLTNYQARENDPAVLVLVCTDTGTSAQVMTQRSATLFCNNKGSKHTFVAERLSTDRAKRGVATTGAMTEAEEARNYVMLVQIPLEQKLQPAFSFGGPTTGGFGGFGASPTPGVFGSAPCMAFGATQQCNMAATSFGMPAAPSFSFGAAVPSTPNVEAAMVGLSDAKGPFPKLSAFSHVRRNAKYPIRVTVQFYQATSNGVVSAEIIQDLASKMDHVKTNATWWGSLVTPGSPPPIFGSSIVHPHAGVNCDMCRSEVITALRYKCAFCADYDVCANCIERADTQHPHPFLRLTKASPAYGAKTYAVMNRATVSHYVACSSCTANIVGVLYQCTHCPNVRLCEVCEATTGHGDFQHPLIKIFQAAI